MNKNIYHLINDVETDFSEYERTNTLDDVSVKRLKKHLHQKITPKRRYTKGLTAACLALAITGLALGPFSSQTQAFAKRISYDIASSLGISADLTPYQNVVNQSVTKNGITITLKEAILTNDSLIIAYEETGLSSVNPDSSSFGTLYVNGRQSSGGGGSSSVPYSASGESVLQSVMEYDIDVTDFSEPLNIEMVFENESTKEKTRFDFAFQATGEELRANTHSFNPDISFTLPNQSVITLDSFMVSPIGERIYYSHTGENATPNLMLEGTDNLGNPISFYLSRADKKGGRFNLDFLVGPISAKATSLTLTPYYAFFPETSGKMNDDWEVAGDAFTIDLK